MNRRARTILALWSSSTLLIAWSATLRNGYNSSYFLLEDATRYYWEYPAVFGVAGALVAAALRPWRTDASALGGGLGFILFSALFAWSFLGSMHAPPAHAVFLLVTLVFSQVSLFYFGWSIAYFWKANRKDVPNAV